MIKLFNRFAMFLYENPGAYMLYYIIVFVGGYSGIMWLVKL